MSRSAIELNAVCGVSPGLVEIEEGELAGQLLSLQSRALARTSFAKEPHVRQVKPGNAGPDWPRPVPTNVLSLLPVRTLDLQVLPAESRRQTGADGLHGDRGPAANAALAHYLPAVFLMTWAHGATSWQRV